MSERRRHILIAELALGAAASLLILGSVLLLRLALKSCEETSETLTANRSGQVSFAGRPPSPVPESPARRMVRTN